MKDKTCCQASGRTRIGNGERMKERKSRQREEESPKARRWEGIGVGELLNLVAMAKAAGVEKDRRVKSLLKAVRVLEDPELARYAREYINALAVERALDDDPFAPAPEEEAWGEFVVGRVRGSGAPFGFRPEEICQHLFIPGRSGAGKTTFIKRLLKEVLKHAGEKDSDEGEEQPVPRILVFDIKRDYEELKFGNERVWSFRLSRPEYRWNPLESPLKNWKQWAGIFAASFANSCGFYGGQSTENFIYKVLCELYARYDPTRKKFPCMLDLLDYLRYQKVRAKPYKAEEYNWLVRTLNRVESICNCLGETLNCSRGFSLSEVLKRDVIFDLAELKPDAQSFFAETFLIQAIWHRLEEDVRGGVLRNVVVFDEAKRLYPSFREEVQRSVANTSNIIALAREFGLGLVLADCDPRLISHSIKSSSYARVCFNLTHGADIRDCAHSLGLEREQAEEIMRLERGEAVVRLGGRIDLSLIHI